MDPAFAAINGKSRGNAIMAWHSLSDRLDEPRACLPRRLSAQGRVACRLKAHQISVEDFPWEHLPNPHGETGRREMLRTERWPSG
ncbi:hypothetical protein MPLSOD_140541 [Mesorhizobium sp. SOD10]|nr:hypothetical protein MPLSOD_140541 [Mesorhizobium sp. SOD10]